MAEIDFWKVYRQIRDDEFVIAGSLRSGSGFGFSLDSTPREDNVFLVSAGCEAIIIEGAIFERMRNLKVDANLTLLRGTVSSFFSK